MSCCGFSGHQICNKQIRLFNIQFNKFKPHYRFKKKKYIEKWIAGTNNVKGDHLRTRKRKDPLPDGTGNPHWSHSVFQKQQATVLPPLCAAIEGKNEIFYMNERERHINTLYHKSCHSYRGVWTTKESARNAACQSGQKPIDSQL